VITALDTNIPSALWSAEPLAREIAAVLAQARSNGGLIVCGPVYAELLAYPGASQSFVDDFLLHTRVTVEFDLGEKVWREAGRRFALYAQRRRHSGGKDPKRLLVDFVVGAHALLRADRLLTLDATIYRRDFPELHLLELIPDKET
jgi:predicted nucleic acid-binding protein